MSIGGIPHFVPIGVFTFAVLQWPSGNWFSKLNLDLLLAGTDFKRLKVRFWVPAQRHGDGAAGKSTDHIDRADYCPTFCSHSHPPLPHAAGTIYLSLTLHSHLLFAKAIRHHLQWLLSIPHTTPGLACLGLCPLILLRMRHVRRDGSNHRSPLPHQFKIDEQIADIDVRQHLPVVIPLSRI